VQYSSDLVSFLADKKVFIHDVDLPDLAGIQGCIPIDADTIIADNFPYTRHLKMLPRYWISPRDKISTYLPYQYATTIRGKTHPYYVYEFKQEQITGEKVVRMFQDGKDFETIAAKIREGPDLEWSGSERVVLISRDTDLVPCAYDGTGFKALETTCMEDHVKYAAFYLMARHIDTIVLPKFMKQTGDVHYFYLDTDELPLVPRDDVVKTTVFEFLPRGLKDDGHGGFNPYGNGQTMSYIEEPGDPLVMIAEDGGACVCHHPQVPRFTMCRFCRYRREWGQNRRMGYPVISATTMERIVGYNEERNREANPFWEGGGPYEMGAQLRRRW
jgi:hypothetical protein